MMTVMMTVIMCSKDDLKDDKCMNQDRILPFDYPSTTYWTIIKYIKYKTLGRCKYTYFHLYSQKLLENLELRAEVDELDDTGDC